MKVVHHNKEHVEPGEDMLEQALSLEKDGELDKAASLYLRYLKKIPGNEYAFSRLMIIYRKQRDTKKELDIIDRAINTFEEIFKKTIKITPSKKTIAISHKLMKAMGLADKKGKELFEREPLKTWRKRKQMLMRRK